jgi:hypothetical protein
MVVVIRILIFVLPQWLKEELVEHIALAAAMLEMAAVPGAGLQLLAEEGLGDMEALEVLLPMEREDRAIQVPKHREEEG